jgi:hypothetical protein
VKERMASKLLRQTLLRAEMRRFKFNLIPNHCVLLLGPPSLDYISSMETV